MDLQLKFLLSYSISRNRSQNFTPTNYHFLHISDKFPGQCTKFSFKKLKDRVLFFLITLGQGITLGNLASRQGNFLGGYMTTGWTGVCHPVFRKLPHSNY